MSTAIRNIRRSTSTVASHPSSTSPLDSMDRVVYTPEEDEDLALRFDDDHPGQENFDEKVQRAQEQLLHLRQKQASIEKAKSEMEELGQKQERFVRGRLDLSEKLNRALAILDRETYETQSRLEQLALTQDGFSRHLAILEGFRPEHWSRADLRSELNHAIGAIEDADDDYARSMARLRVRDSAAATSGTAPGAPGGDQLPAAGLATWAEKSFLDWLKVGTAFTLPLMVCLFFYVILKLVFLF